MSFFVVVKGCVNFHEMTSQYIKNAYSHAESLRKWERFLKTTASLSNLIPPCFLKTTASLSNLIPPCFYYLTNLVSVSYAPASLMPRLMVVSLDKCM